MTVSVLCAQVLIWNDLQEIRFKQVRVLLFQPFHHLILPSVKLCVLTRAVRPRLQVKNERSLLHARSLSPVSKNEVST